MAHRPRGPTAQSASAILRNDASLELGSTQGDIRAKARAYAFDYTETF